MSLLGDKCDRCGTRTRSREHDQPICETCAREMALLVQAAAEAPRLCPADGEQMSKEIAHMIVIDRCPRCHGVWLDGGELEYLQTSEQDAALRSMAMSFTQAFG